MGETTKKSIPVIGLIFMALGVFKFFQGEGWVVWVILGFLFGGFGIFAGTRKGEGES